MNRALSILVLLNGPSIVWQPIHVLVPLDETRFGNIPQYADKHGKVASNASTTVASGRPFPFILGITLKSQPNQSRETMSTSSTELANKKASDLDSKEMRTTTRR